MRYLAIDLGDKRTGLAVGDDETGLATPAATLPVAPGPPLVDAILRMILEHETDTLVLGLPLNADGSEGPRAKLTRRFGMLLQDATDVPLHYQDERLTTWAADQRLAGTGRTHRQKKAARDAIAAAEILQDFLRARRRA
ncbi:MAG: Holliday junction resolvase RuvX [Phycisphaerales bacterium]